MTVLSMAVKSNQNRSVFAYRIEFFGSNRIELYADRIEGFFDF